MSKVITLSDWLENSMPVFQPKLIAPCTRDFSRALSKLQVISWNSDWFIAPFAPVVIGRNNYLGTGFSTVIGKPLYIHIFLSNTKIRLCVDAYDVRLHKCEAAQMNGRVIVTV